MTQKPFAVMIICFPRPVSALISGISRHPLFKILVSQ